MTLVSRIIRSAVVVLSLLALPLSAAPGRHRSVAPPGLPPGATVRITGIIRDEVTGAALLGAEVSAEGHKGVAPTDRSGLYTIEVTKGKTVAITAEHFAYNAKTLTVDAQPGAALNFTLTPKQVVTVKLVNGSVFVLDIDSAQFAYLVPFSGYIRGDIANFCKDDGTSITPDKHEIARVVGPAQPVSFAPCCTIGPIMKANVEMKSGDKFAVYFNDSCFGNEVDFLGREKSTGVFQYFNFKDIAEVDFP